MISRAPIGEFYGVSVTLGERTFELPATAILTMSESGAVAGLVRVDLAPGESSNIDLTSEILVDPGTDDQEPRIFTGVVQKATATLTQIDFEVTSPIALLEEQRTQGVLGFAGVPVPETLAYVLTASGVPAERQNIEGFPTGGPDTPYFCIFPVEGLHVEGELSVGLVTLYGEDATTERDIQLASNSARLPWAGLGFDARARVVVAAADFMQAEAIARQAVQKALEWISFRLRHSEALPSGVIDAASVAWDRRRAIGVPRLTDQFHAYRYLPAGAISGSWASAAQPSDVEPLSGKTSTNDLKQFFPPLTNAGSTKDGEIPVVVSMSEAMHWLHRSDTLIDFSICGPA